MTGFERTIGRLLIAITYAATGLLAVGVLLMLASGTPPLSGGPGFDPGTLIDDLVAFRPSGFIWLGLLLVIATPVSRVVAAAVAFGLAGERRMVVVALAIVGVIAISVVTAVAAG